MEVSLAPDLLFKLGPIDVTNSLFTTIIILFLIIFFSFYINKKLNYENPRNFQILLEYAIGGLYDMMSGILGKDRIKTLFPFIFTFFTFILISNWFGLLPITPSLSIDKKNTETEYSETTETLHSEEYPKTSDLSEHETEIHSNTNNEIKDENDKNHAQESSDSNPTLQQCIDTKHCYLTINGIKMFHHPTHILRPPTSDISADLAFAIISVIVTNFLGFKYLGLSYLKKYLNFKGPIDFVVGILEIVSELGKIVSFSFRLFGNIFAGEVLISVITSISFGLATLPFLGLEIFVGFMQAFVFTILTTVFISLAIKHHDH